MDSIQDLLHLRDEEEYIRLHRGDGLPKLLHGFKQRGFEPLVECQARTISKLEIKWKIKS